MEKNLKLQFKNGKNIKIDNSQKKKYKWLTVIKRQKTFLATTINNNNKKKKSVRVLVTNYGAVTWAPSSIFPLDHQSQVFKTQSYTFNQFLSLHFSCLDSTLGAIQNKRPHCCWNAGRGVGTQRMENYKIKVIVLFYYK